MTSNINSNSRFTPFSTDVEQYKLPERFTFPYYYSPHPLAQTAMDELQALLENKAKWQQDLLSLGASSQGKMFAVLVVQNEHGELGYLSSYAGAGHAIESELKASKMFVEPNFDVNDHQAVLAPYKQALDEAKEKLAKLEQQHQVNRLTEELSSLQSQAEQEITSYQSTMSAAKKQRKQQRVEAESKLGGTLTQADLDDLIKDLGNESSREKRALKALKQQWQLKLLTLSEQLECRTSEIHAQQQICLQYCNVLANETKKRCLFLNQSGESKSLFDLFSNEEPLEHASEQNLPKLLNGAFIGGYKPLALGEFWWGASPYDEIRQHKNLYPVCQSKCFEILEHMLDGIALDESPLEQTPSYGKALDIVYEDDVLVVVNKPAEFLSVSGKYISDSVHARIQARYPNATGPLIVHRLDMSTSGLLVLTLTAETNKQVQKQFIDRTVEKRYTALLEGTINSLLIEHDITTDVRENATSGKITLPLCGDMQDRPRQMVNHQQGRYAETSYQVLEVHNNRTKVHLYPKTGRTHQLRVHCAHQAGLNLPIVGDDLYGFKDSRLHLHAGYLKFAHPVTHELLEFEVAAEF